jgi:soluble lytic murein transglycosylase
VKWLITITAVVAVVAGGLFYLYREVPSWYAHRVPGWYARQLYPLKYAPDIRAAAARNSLDPALVAAIIYQESGFRAHIASRRGAIGLMQVLPSTAQEIARRSGGATFVTDDLRTPRINILYGCYYLRYLLDHFGGSRVEAVAAYNAGAANVDRWAARAARSGAAFEVSDIPFSETRRYVNRVARLTEIYHRTYAAPLGLGH